MPRNAVPLMLCLLLVAVGLGACLSFSPKGSTSPAAAYAGDPVALKRGRGIFLGTCAGYCHGVRGSGAGDVPNLFDCNWRHGGSDEEIFASIYNGYPGTRMIGFGCKLEDEDLWKVVAYLRATARCPVD